MRCTGYPRPFLITPPTEITVPIQGMTLYLSNTGSPYTLPTPPSICVPSDAPSPSKHAVAPAPFYHVLHKSRDPCSYPRLCPSRQMVHVSQRPTSNLTLEHVTDLQTQRKHDDHVEQKCMKLHTKKRQHRASSAPSHQTSKKT